MNRLVWLLPGWKSLKTHFGMMWLIYKLFSSFWDFYYNTFQELDTFLQVYFHTLFLYESIFEPSHEIMVLFVLCKLILQTLMCSHPVGLEVWFLVGPFVYYHNSCVRTAKALARLSGYASSPEPLLVAYVVSTIISWAGSFDEYEV